MPRAVPFHKGLPTHTQWGNLTLSQGHGHEGAEGPL